MWITNIRRKEKCALLFNYETDVDHGTLEIVSCAILYVVLLRLVIISWRVLQKVHQEHKICVCLIQHLQKKKVLCLLDKNISMKYNYNGRDRSET
jgi:hypothetical protein